MDTNGCQLCEFREAKNSPHSPQVEKFNFCKKFAQRRVVKANPLSCSAYGECNCCSRGAEETIRLEVKVTELCEPTGDVIYKYIYI